MLARRNEHYEVLVVFSGFNETAEDDGAPLLVFKPFTGVINSAVPPEGSPLADLNPEDFKFDLGTI
jgi:hypothetical protein